MIEISNFAAICILLLMSFTVCFGLYWERKYREEQRMWRVLVSELHEYGLYDDLLRHRHACFTKFCRDNPVKSSEPDITTDVYKLLNDDQPPAPDITQ